MPTANNKVDGSIKDKSQVLDGPRREPFGSLFFVVGLDNAAIADQRKIRGSPAKSGGLGKSLVNL